MQSEWCRELCFSICLISLAVGCESVLTAQGNWISIDLTGESCYLFIWLLDNPPIAVASGSIMDKDKHLPELEWWHFR